jgi:RNA polymerase sigma factor (sigma-70 family)
VTVGLLKDLRERSQDGKAWENAYRALRPAVYRTAYSLTGGNVAAAEDLTQEAFLRFLQYTDLNALDSDEHLLSYLRQTVRHLCWDRKKNAVVTTSVDTPEAQFMLNRGADNEEVESLAWDIEQLSGTLPELERQLLRELITGSPLADIARKLNITYGAAAVRVHRLRAKLRHIINDL